MIVFRWCLKITANGKALLSGFEFEKQKSKIYFMDAQSYFDSQAHFNKWLKQLTEDEQRMVVDMLNEFRQQNLQQCNVSGALPLVEQSLLDEAVSDVITISTLNEYSVAKKLISEQFIVIDKQDLSGNDR